MAKKRICSICGKEYEYCGHCPNKNAIEHWRNLYCSENCREAFQLFGDYKIKKKTATEVKEILSGWGLTPQTVREIHKPIVNKIFEEGTVVIKADEPVQITEATNESQENQKKEESLFRKNKKKKSQEDKIVNED